MCNVCCFHPIKQNATPAMVQINTVGFVNKNRCLTLLVHMGSIDWGNLEYSIVVTLKGQGYQNLKIEMKVRATKS